MDLTDKVAIITGAARGLGESLAGLLLKKGAKVCMCDVLEDVGRAACTTFQNAFGEDKVIFLICDVRDEEQFKGVFKTVMEKFGRLDIMVNNAGLVNESRWEDVIDINVKGIVRGSLLAMDYMRIDKGGRGGVILNTGSSSAFLVKEHCFVPTYSASKQAVVGYTRCLSSHPEVQQNGIRIACLNPSAIKTSFFDGKPTTIYGNFDPQSVLGYYMSPEEAAEGFIKLLDDQDNNGACMRIEKNENGIWTEYA